ncbi:uncharacterized protein RCC_10507 [Ramularia collo-cygni]|uniref:Beta-lactamase-related domain-containing protein n=1 Tax=Ramularia collo-cygni TaxID=112498 RepID=A0A2D3VM04_9PEZI|nr:uncharacterized protein RCC_10507 [Ramularia collo-cygni]CZT24779.1 uncharacterized protein RCC_10507 [Ramularia collo-cygni]
MPEQETPYERFAPDFEAFVESTIKESNTAGIAILMLHQDRTWAQGFGFADVDKKILVTPQTLFFAGSTTKSFTSAMAAALVESSEHSGVDWNTPLADLIAEDFVLDQNSPEGRYATDHVTLEDALSHRTGMPRHDLIWMNGDVSDREIVRSLRHVPIARDLRAKWEYCNNMYTAVAHSISKTLATPFKVLLKEYIFEPLGMKYTTYDLSDAQDLASKDSKIELAQGYLWDSQSKQHTLVGWEAMPAANGAGGIISNVLDYGIWLRHLLKPTNLNAALSEKAVNAMSTPRMLLEADKSMPYVGPQAYGLGLFSQVYRGREILQHSGAIFGYMASMLIVPPTKAEVQSGNTNGGWAIVIMQNSYSLASQIIAWNLLDTLLETPGPERFDMATVARIGQAKMEEEMQPANVLQRLFGKTDLTSDAQRVLEPQSYAGMYEHTAYHGVEVSTTPPPIAGDIGVDDATKLYLSPSGPSMSCAFWASLHHVSGNWWWAHRRFGRPSSWITDGALKVQFVVNSDGLVEGMNFQAEPSMPNEELAFFKKLE